VDYDPASHELRIPEDAEGREILARYFRQPAFRTQFIAAHALTINHQGPEGKLHFILLNGASAAQWTGMEDALLAHELGHAWLDERGYKSPAYAAAERSCVAIHAGDMVQHILIRDETNRRGIAARHYWLRNLRAASAYLENRPAGQAEPPCQKLIRLTQLLDVRLGLSQQDWDGFDHFLELYQTSYPDLLTHADAMESFLRDHDVSQPADFAAALEFVKDRLERLYDAQH
jgi:hypothetical protein